ILSGNLSYVLISIIGCILVTNRVIAIGDIQAFITYTRQFNQPINQIANIANVIQATIAASERVFELLDEEELTQETITESLPGSKGHVVFNRVQFGYGDELLMNDLHIE